MKKAERERLDREREERAAALEARYARERTAAQDAGGYEGTFADQIPPLACSYCGCVVLHRLAVKHRQRCVP